MNMRGRFVGFLYGIDEGFNALFGGSPLQTISGTCGRAAAKNKWWAVHLAVPIVNTIMNNPNHCQEAMEHEANRVIK